MHGGMFTPQEEELLRTLLAQKGITRYQLFETVGEGKQLPGSTYPSEIESISGFVITPTNIYYFWFDWFDEHYTLGEEEGYWEEYPLEEMGQYKARAMQIQQQLREEDKG